MFLPAFYEEYKGNCCYAAFSEEMLTDAERLKAYAGALLDRMLKLARKKKLQD